MEDGRGNGEELLESAIEGIEFVEELESIPLGHPIPGIESFRRLSIVPTLSPLVSTSSRGPSWENTHLVLVYRLSQRFTLLIQLPLPLPRALLDEKMDGMRLQR